MTSQSAEPSMRKGNQRDLRIDVGHGGVSPFTEPTQLHLLLIIPISTSRALISYLSRTMSGVVYAPPMMGVIILPPVERLVAPLFWPEIVPSRCCNMVRDHVQHEIHPSSM